MQILEHDRVLIDKEPPLRLEVAELKNQMHGGRCGVHAIHGLAFRRTQVEIEEAVVLGEARQSVEVIDFPCRQDRQAARIGTHGTAHFTECGKYTYCTVDSYQLIARLSPFVAVQKLLL